MKLWTPLQTEDQKRDAQIDRSIYLAKEFNRQLRDLDDRLELVFVKPTADDPVLVPGRWHIRHVDPDGIVTYMVIAGPQGEYLEPHSGVLDELRARSLFTDQGIRAAKERVERKNRERQREAERQAEDRKAELAERVASTIRTQVRF